MKDTTPLVLCAVAMLIAMTTQVLSVLLLVNALGAVI